MVACAYMPSIVKDEMANELSVGQATLLGEQIISSSQLKTLTKGGKGKERYLRSNTKGCLCLLQPCKCT